MIRTLGRVLTGFALACVAAGFMQLMFAKPPSKIAASATGDTGQLVLEMIDYALLFATHTAIFSAAFALIAAGIGEWTGMRAMAYYLFAGTVIALLGFAAQFASEAPGQPTIFNNYALKTFLTAGFFAGLVYWMAAGRKAGGVAQDQMPAASGDDSTSGVPPPARTWKTRPRLIIEDSPKPGTKTSRSASLAERLAVSEDQSASRDQAASSSAAPAARPAVPVEISNGPADARAAAAAAAKVAQAKPSANVSTTTSVPSTRPPASPAALAADAPESEAAGHKPSPVPEKKP